MDYPICQNPNCKSHGRSHPNCKCDSKEQMLAEGGSVLPSFDSLPDDNLTATSQFNPQQVAPTNTGEFDSLQDDFKRHDTVPGYIASGAEGALNTMTAGLAPKGLAAIGVDNDFQRQLKEENPVSYAVGQAAGLITGPVAKLIGLAGKATSAAVGSGVLGSAAGMGAETALLQTTDELAKYTMQDPNQSVQTAMTDIALSGVLGGALGGVSGLAAKGVEKVADTRAGEFINDFRNRVLEHVRPEEPVVEHVMEPGEGSGGVTKGPIKNFPTAPGTPLLEEAAPKPITYFRLPEEMGKPDSIGAKAADVFMKSKLAGSGLGFEAGALAGHATGIPGMGYFTGMVGAKVLGPTIDALIKPIISGVMGISGPGFNAAANLLDGVAKGNKLLSTAAKSVFESGVSTGMDLHNKDKVNKLREHLEALDANPEAMMNVGGQLGHYLPDQQKALAMTAQGAVSYLSAKAPRPMQPGILDKAIAPSKASEAAYERTLGIAEQPLVVLQHLKAGNLQPNDVRDLNALYPALAPKIVQEVHNHLISHISKGHSVPFKLRAGITHLTGHPIDTSFTQPAIMAAQMTFIQPQQPQGAPATKKGTAKLGKSAELAQTPSEARNKALSKA